MLDTVTIVGASLAGFWAAETLRRDGFAGPIALIGEEPHAPYDRPPLSKKYLAGELDDDRLDLVPANRLDDLDLDLRLGCRATGLEVASRTLEVDGIAEPFDGLVLATGARCRTLPDTAGMDGVYTLRTRDDAAAIRDTLAAGTRRLTVVGAGFIGAEVASTAIQRGVEVTMVEALDTPFGRALGTEMGAVVADVHRSHGVELRTGTGVDRVLGGDRVTGVRLTDGATLDTDLMEGSGLILDDGVVCDATCLAADRVVAAGDVARWPNPRYEGLMRVEHWDNAVQQGVHAARRLLQTEQEATPFAPVPWFWSDQYDRKVQLAGRTHPDDDVQVAVGSTVEHRFAAFYGREGRFTAVLGMNRPRYVMQAKALLEQDASWDEAQALAADWN